MTRAAGSRLLMLLALAGAACSPSPTAGTPGELGNGRFIYSCENDSDPLCDDNATQHSMPPAVALKNTFRVSFQPTKSSTSATVASASSLFLETVTSSSFRAIKVGLAGLIAEADGKMLDIAHVRIVQAVDMRVDALASGGSAISEGVKTLSLPRGDHRELRAIVLDENGAALAGALEGKWTTSDPSIVAIAGDFAPNPVLFGAQKAGTATMHVAAGAWAADVVVTVTESGAGGGGGGGTGGAGGAGTGGAGTGGAGTGGAGTGGAGGGGGK